MSTPLSRLKLDACELVLLEITVTRERAKLLGMHRTLEMLDLAVKAAQIEAQRPKRTNREILR